MRRIQRLANEVREKARRYGHSMSKFSHGQPTLSTASADSSCGSCQEQAWVTDGPEGVRIQGRAVKEMCYPVGRMGESVVAGDVLV